MGPPLGVRDALGSRLIGSMRDAILGLGCIIDVYLEIER